MDPSFRVDLEYVNKDVPVIYRMVEAKTQQDRLALSDTYIKNNPNYHRS